MARVFDSSFIFDFVQSFWRDYYKDRSHLDRLWEAAARLMDDEWAQAEQVNDSAYVVSLPTLIYHTHLYRELKDWQSYGLPHRHFRRDWRSLAGQTIFYTGGWPDPLTTQVFLNGKEADDLLDPYIVTQTQDSTQPGVNPSGVRLIFNSPIPPGIAVSMFSDREFVTFEYEVPPGGLASIPFPADIDPDSVQIVIKKIRITSQLALASDSFSYAALPSTASDTRVFRLGEVFEVVDGASVQVIGLDGDVSSVSLNVLVNPATAQVFKLVNFDISHGKVTLDGNKIVAVEQVFPANTLVRVADIFDSMGLTTSMPMRVIEYPREVNPEEYHAYMFGGEIVNGYTSDSSAVQLRRSFIAGTVLGIQAALSVPNDHAEYREIISAPTDRISVPVTRPFALDPLFQEQPEYPIQFFIDGHLQATDTYTFISTTTIVLNSTTMPAGTSVDVYYVDLEDPIPHRHVREYFRIQNPVPVVVLNDYVSSRFARYVNVGGIELGDPLQRNFRENGKYIYFSSLLSSGTLVRVRGAHASYAYHHDFTDDPMVSAAYMQNGIDERSSTIPAGWTVQLPWLTGFSITPNLLEANAKIEEAWFVDADVDERTGYHNFGSLIGLDRPTSAEYTRLLKAMVPGSYLGSRTGVVESLGCIVLGSEYIAAPAKVDYIIEDSVHVGGDVLVRDHRVPLRVQAGSRYGRLEAVSGYVSILDRWEPFDALALLGSQFSETYTFARTLDVSAEAVLTGGPCWYRRSKLRLEDNNTDFIAEEVWPGDLVMARATLAPTEKIYGRVTSVSQHHIIVSLAFTIPPAGYGSGFVGQYAYGVSDDLISVDDFIIWVRDTDKIDTWKHMDEASPEDIPYLTSRLHDLLSPFVFLAEIRWAAVSDESSLRDLVWFLDRAKPHDTKYIAYTKVEEGGLRDEIEGTPGDDDPVLTEMPNFVFVTSEPLILSIIGIDGQISPNVGSFIGV